MLLVHKPIYNKPLPNHMDWIGTLYYYVLIISFSVFFVFLWLFGFCLVFFIILSGGDYFGPIDSARGQWDL